MKKNKSRKVQGSEHLLSSVAMTAGCVGMQFIQNGPHLWHWGARVNQGIWKRRTEKKLFIREKLLFWRSWGIKNINTNVCAWAAHMHHGWIWECSVSPGTAFSPWPDGALTTGQMANSLPSSIRPPLPPSLSPSPAPQSLVPHLPASLTPSVPLP